MFADLLAHDGVEEELVLRGRFGFLAFHGGNLERGTDRIAAAAAEASGASLYVVRQPPDLRWHVPSRLVDPADSAPLAAFVEHVAVCVAVHGYGRDGCWTTLLLGGTNRDLAAALAEELRRALPAYEHCDDLDAIPRELRGVHRENPVNRPALGGVQLELPPRVRGQTPRSVPGDETALVGALAAVARTFPTTG